jgi:hypothetical protein
MSESYRNLLIEAAVWVASLAGCAGALALSRRDPPKWPFLALTLSVLTLVVGCVGLWTPFSVVPRVAYSWTNGGFRLYLDLNQFFVVPLVLGSLGILLAVWRRSHSNRTLRAAESNC